MRVLQTPATPRNTLILPYKEGVAGSNPASPTTKKSIDKPNACNEKDPWTGAGSLPTSPLHHPRLSEGFSDGVGGLASPAGEHVGVGVEGEGDGRLSVTEVIGARLARCLVPFGAASQQRKPGRLTGARPDRILCAGR
jgi:hypothetical protein